ncbi:MAG: PD-(D/E)XK nuclease family protein [Acidiferrobacter sp.]
MVLKIADEFTIDSDPGLFSALAAGATVVTANNRLARHIALLWGRARHAAGRTVWETPDVLPWTAYINRTADLVRAGLETPAAALSETQERWLWADLVRTQEAGFLCADEAFGELAAEAWGLLADHALALPAGNGSPETEAFVALARAFTERLRTLHREDRARDSARVTAAWRAGALKPPDVLVWAGFQQLTPAQRQINDACLAAGGVCQMLALPQSGGSVQALIFATVEQELTAAFLWAQERLQQHAEGRYALVVPDLERYRLAMTRLAADVFSVAAHSPLRPYGFSLGASLKDAPVVAAGLRVWGLIQAPLDPLDAALLIQSPFLSGAQSERAVRAQLAYTVLEGGAPLGLQDIAAVMRTPHTHAAGAAFARLTGMVRAWPRRARASVWAGLFMKALEALGWPGSASRVEYQAVAALRDALESIAGLDAVAGPVSYGSALASVQEVLARRVFQAGESEARLQIMGPLESLGLPFDGLWVLNLHDRVWPAMRQPHPLLPLAFQREHHLPHADIEEDVRYAQALIEDFLGAAPEVCLSAALHDGQDPQRPSRLLEKYAPQSAPAPFFMGRAARDFAARLPLEEIPETPAPLLSPRTHGYGVGLFAAQAACPFQAAAQYRLRANPLNPPSYGLAPSVRGAVVHKALEQWFRTFPDQASWMVLALAAKERQIEVAVDTALAGAHAAYSAFPKAFLLLEARRIQDLLRGFLAVEESRGPFRVQACEQEVTFACGALTARGRIDRIDRVDDKLVLIDYKTGKVPTLDLTSDRPMYPQLLFYAVAEGHAVAGFAYAAISARATAYKAWASAPDLLPGATVIPEWETLAATWPVLFRRLATEFLEGGAAVDPQPTACDYCGRESLCRIGERGHDDDR